MLNIFMLTIALAAKDPIKPKPIDPIIVAKMISQTKDSARYVVLYKGNYNHFYIRAANKERRRAAKAGIGITDSRLESELLVNCN